MAIIHVIIRELRAQVRQPLTYWLRIVAGLFLVSALGLSLSILDPQRYFGQGSPFATAMDPSGAGQTLFGMFNLSLFLAIWILVPLAGADALSRERREQTLSLLFLTRLRAWEVVSGKAIAHAARAMTVVLAMVPWVILPTLFGGIGYRDILMALLLNGGSLLLALAAGLLGSSFARDWVKSVIMAELLALVFLWAMLAVHEQMVSNAAAIGTAAGRPVPRLAGRVGAGLVSLPESGVVGKLVERVGFTTDSSIWLEGQWIPNPAGSGGNWLGKIESPWGKVWANFTPAAERAWFFGALRLIGYSALVFMMALAAAVWCVRHSWRDAPASRMQSELRRTFFTPRFAKGALRRRLRRALSANPIGWLQQHSPSARLVKWGWCLFIIFVEILLSGSTTDLYGAQYGLGTILLLGLAFNASSSFREELSNGAFELLLVTPLREHHIISGRLRGLWNQFLPSLVLFCAGGIYLSVGWSGENYAEETIRMLGKTGLAFAVIPIVGLYLSILQIHFFAAWILTCLVGLMPAGLASAFGVSFPGVVLTQLFIGTVAGWLLLQRLRKRTLLADSTDSR